MAKKMIFAILWLVMGFILFTNNAICADSVRILYRCASTSSTTNTIQPWFKVVNNGTTTLDLNRVKIRYWYTRDTGRPQAFTCDWAQIGSGNVTGTFVPVADPPANADYYFETGFTTGAGSLAPGADSGEIQLRIYKDDWSNYTQTNDYSFDASKTAFGEHINVTGYIDGVLVFGAEPIAPTVTLKKIDLNQERLTLKAIITTIDNGRYGQRDDIELCFDGDPGTYTTSNEAGVPNPNLNDTNPAYVQVEFATAKNIKRVRGYLANGQSQSWWVEVADTQSDMTNRTGTYQILIPSGPAINIAQWVEYNYSTPITKKFWKFNIRATAAGNQGAVNLPELELWSDDTEAPSDPSQLNATTLDATSIALSWTGSTDNVEVSGYKVYRVNGTEYEYLGMTTVTKYTDTLLNPSTSYSYAVSAVDSTGNESAKTGTVTAGTDGSTTIRTINNVLVLYYNPIIKAGTYQYYDPVDQEYETKVIDQDIKFSELYGGHAWADFSAKKFADNIKKATGGSVDFRIYQTIESNDIPPANSPEWMNSNVLIEFMELGFQGHRTKDYDVLHHGGFNYRKMIRDNNIISLVENGAVDTVWVFCSSPNAGMAETSMSGINPFYVNGHVNVVACSKKFVTYIANSVECMGHMVETAMDHASANWATQNYNVLNTRDLNDPYRQIVTTSGNIWNVFTLADAYNPYGYEPQYNYEPKTVAPGYSQLGNMHCPPNGYKNYSWYYPVQYFEGNSDLMLPIDGVWDLDANAYRANSGSSVKSLLAEVGNVMTFGNFIAETDLKLGNDGAASSSAGVIFRVTNYGAGENAFRGYYAGISAADDRVFLAKINNNYTELKSVAKTINPGEFYHLKIVVNDGNFTVYVDDMSTPVIDCYDPNYYNLSGGFGLRANQTTAWYDNLWVNPTATGYADTWYNYPDLSGVPKLVSFDDWGGSGDGFQLWWFSHIPKNPGLNSGILNNWWPYIIDVNRFDGSPIGYQVNGFPAPPAMDVKAQTVTNNSVTLTWTVPPVNSGVVGSKIYRDGALIATTTGSTHTDNNLTANTTYKYSVVTYNGAGTNAIPIHVEATTMTGTAFFSGFEKISALSTIPMPDGWSIGSSSGNVIFSADGGVKLNGDYSAGIINNSNSDSMFIQTISIKAKTDYRISVWVKTSAFQGSASLMLGYSDGVWTYHGGVSGDSDWAEISYEFNSGYNTALEIRCRADGRGTAWFDDVMLVEQPLINLA